ncbi:restriction endonuclease subunit S [Agrobacterium tumefaciens]|uniref:restriction endonuclease subunit S n=1 Tax=Agrobacterium tumefaciens TaxID=358 RepID=UPI001EEF47E6|nr:restriction endonuclease subunit S [Agrobacterium tumefaciens]
MRVTAEASGSEGQPWTLPEGWCWAVLGDLANLIRGVSYKKEQSTSEYTREKIPLLRGNNIQSGYIDNTELIYVNSDCVSPPQILDESDIILTMSSGSISLIGKSAYFTSPSEKVTFGAFCGCLRSKDIIFARWIYHYLQTSYYRKKISTAAKGTSLNNLKRDHLLSLPIPFCTPENIQQICHEVDRLMAEVENGEAALEDARKGLETFRRALLKSAVTGELTREWRENNQPNETGHDLLARIKGERDATSSKGRSKRAAASQPLDTSELPELPEGWAWARISDVGVVQLGRQRSPQHHQGDNMHRYLRVANVFEDRIELGDVKEMNFTPSELETFELRRNDILLNEGQTPDLLGRSAMWRSDERGMCFQNTLLRFRATEPMEPEFCLLVFRYYLHAKRFKQESQITTNIAHLSSGRFSVIEFPVPPIDEQREIVRQALTALDSTVDAKLVFEQQKADAARLRQAILKSAFEGTLVPQDSSDEPASAMLERLKQSAPTTKAGHRGRGKARHGG